MSDPTNDPNAPAPDSTVNLTGVSSTGEAGSVGTSPAEPPAGQTAPAEAMAVSQPAVTTETPVPPPAPVAAFAPQETAAPTPAPVLAEEMHGQVPYTPVRSDALAMLKDDLATIEEVALFWGGDHGVRIRNAVVRSRMAVFGQ